MPLGPKSCLDNNKLLDTVMFMFVCILSLTSVAPASILSRLGEESAQIPQEYVGDSESGEDPMPWDKLVQSGVEGLPNDLDSQERTYLSSAEKTAEEEEKRGAFSPWSGKRAFSPWSGKRAFSPWSGKRAFSPWSGKRSFSPWSGKRAFSPWSGKRAFSPWSGKRASAELNEIEASDELENADSKRAFNPWGGKRAFNPWSGKRAFNPWSGKRAFNPWSGKRADSPWSGERNGLDESEELLRDVEKRANFSPWKGKRSSGENFHEAEGTLDSWDARPIANV